MIEFTYMLLISGLGLFQAVIVAVIAGLFSIEAKRRKIDNDKQEVRASLRAEESRLAMQLMSANASLAQATGLAIKEGYTNGRMDAALNETEKAQRTYHHFINRIAHTQMAVE